jgi:hypothetical protein
MSKSTLSDTCIQSALNDSKIIARKSRIVDKMNFIRIKDRSDTGCIFKTGSNSSYRQGKRYCQIEVVAGRLFRWLQALLTIIDIDFHQISSIMRFGFITDSA